MLGALLAIGYLALAMLLVHRWNFFDLTGIGRRPSAILLLVKLCASGAMWWTYTYHYPDRRTADLFKYFDDSAAMFSALPDTPEDYVRMMTGIGNDSEHFSNTYYRHMNSWFREYEGNLYNDSHTMIRFNAFVRLFSFGHFPVHMVVAAFLGLVGLTALLRAFLPFFPGQERTLFLLVHGTPTVLFWGSGVIKESLLFFGIGLLLWQVLRWWRGRYRPTDVGLVLFSVALLFFLKFYVLLSMVPGLVALIWCLKRPRRVLFKFAIVTIIFILVGLNVQHVAPDLNVLETIYWKHEDFIGLATSVSSGSYVPPPDLGPSLSSFLRYAPYALYITFLGPLTHPSGGALGWTAAAENLFLFVLIGLLLVHRRRQFSATDRALLLFLISYVLLLGLVIGYTTPVMGALVRYRTPMVPFLLMAALLMHDPERRLVRTVPILFPRPR
ncbi:MAG: hypothetical protein H6594_06750 [Flavobacteriales bacterium]|nr:hypothetical protein [Flavobacteriales bacterium]